MTDRSVADDGCCAPRRGGGVAPPEVTPASGSDGDVDRRGLVDIPAGSSHRMGNPGEATLIFVEVQRGDYFGEDDIERLEDDFGRIDA